MSKATITRRTSGAVDETTQRQIDELRRRARKPDMEIPTMSHQGTFWSIIDRDVDEDRTESAADAIKRATYQAKALTSMVSQANAQPAFADKLHAIQRAAEIATEFGKALDHLARSMESGE